MNIEISNDSYLLELITNKAHGFKTVTEVKYDTAKIIKKGSETLIGKEGYLCHIVKNSGTPIRFQTKEYLIVRSGGVLAAFPEEEY